jgi:hypothetical protein
MIVFQDGLDSFATTSDIGLRFTNGGAATLNLTGGRYGGGSIVLSGSVGSYFGFALPNPSIPGTGWQETWTGFGATITSAGNGGLISWTGVSGAYATLTYDYLTSQFTINDGNTNPGFSYTVSSGWHWFETRMLSAADEGQFELWIDNTKIYENDNIGPSDNHDNAVTSIQIGGNESVGMTVDDIYSLTTSGGGNNVVRLGDGRMVINLPNADVGPNNGTPSGGSSHYAMVDEPQSDYGATYLTINPTSGQQETFSTTSMSETPAEVFSVRVITVAQKTDGGSASQEAIVISDSVTGTGVVFNPTTTWGQSSDIFETDPSTSASWLYTAVNALSVGVKVP